MITKGQRVTVMGLGRFGGGLGVSQWLLDQGAKVVLTDLATEEELSDQIELIKHHKNISLFLENIAMKISLTLILSLLIQQYRNRGTTLFTGSVGIRCESLN